MTEKKKLWMWYKNVFNIDDRTLQSWRGKAQKYGVSLERYADFEERREQNQKIYELGRLSDDDIAFIFNAECIDAGYAKLKAKRKEEAEKAEQIKKEAERLRIANEKKKNAFKEELAKLCEKYDYELLDDSDDIESAIYAPYAADLSFEFDFAIKA